MWFFNKKNKNKEVIIIDVEGNCINTAYVELIKDGKPNIKFNYLHSLDNFKNTGSLRYISLLKKGINKTIDKIQSLHLPPPSYIVCNLPSLLHTSQILIITMKRKNNFTVKKELIDSLIKREVDNKKINNKKDDETLCILEKKIIAIKLNGYEISAPYNKKANTIEILLYITQTTHDILDNIRSAIAEKFHNENIIFHTSSFIIFDMIRKILPNEKNFIAIDVTGDVTEILVAQNGDFVDFFSYPFGKNSLINQISNNKNIEAYHAVDEVRLYNEKIEKKAENDGDYNLSIVQKEWLTLFNKAIDKIYVDGYFPKKVFIVDDGLTSSIFKQWLEDKNENINTNGDKKITSYMYDNFSIEILSSKILENQYINSNKNNAVNLHLLSQAIFVNKM